MSGAIPKGFIRPKKDEEIPVGEPLDKKIMTLNSKGLDKRVSALHIGWAEKRTVTKYIPPPLDENGVYPAGAQEMWLEQMEYLEDDLKLLLSLPHHRFWSQVVYDPGVHECLESYLISARRSFDDDFLDDFSAPVVESIHNLVLLVCIRMATYKESKENHITPAVFGEMIYENFLFDICKIFDICILYGHTNPQLITKMIGNIFTNQAKYYTDLSETIPTISLALNNIEEKLGVAENLMPVALCDSPGQLSIEDIHDITLFLSDTLISLQMFLTCHTPASKYFHEVSFEIRLCACYERIIPAMTDVLSEQDDPQQQLWITKLMKRIELARSAMLKIFRIIVQHKCFEPLKMDKASPSLVGECVDKFLHVMSTCIGEKTFIADYCSVYPLSEDLAFFRKYDGDVTSLDFITDAVSTVMTEMGLMTNVKDLGSVEESTAKNLKSQSDTSGMNGYAETGSAIPSDIELKSMISHVQDLLPGLGAGFIQQCLQYYGYSNEAVINALLEDSLPPSLVTLDRSAPFVEKPVPELPPKPADTEEKAVKQIDCMDRANIYSHDEFDVFSRKDVDHSKIHKGKKNNKFLNEVTDENERERLKEIARQYEETGGTSIYEDEFRYDEDANRGWEYDDEYDDTYDDNETGKNIDSVNLEFVKRRPGIIGAGRLNTHIDYSGTPVASEEENSDTEGKQENKPSQGGVKPKNNIMGNTRGVQRIFNSTSSKSSTGKPKENTPTPEREQNEDRPKENGYMNFCENPQDVRLRAEQRRLDRNAYGNRGYRGNAQHTTQENGPANNQYSSKPKVSLSSNRNSGKEWRQGQSAGGDDDNRRYHGGKYKEDTNHGKAQTQNHRHKMMHKNEHKRQGAQAKFNRNN